MDFIEGKLAYVLSCFEKKWVIFGHFTLHWQEKTVVNDLFKATL
jgi:hypothetical protein